jgi:hypothetical protein
MYVTNLKNYNEIFLQTHPPMTKAIRFFRILFANHELGPLQVLLYNIKIKNLFWNFALKGPERESYCGRHLHRYIHDGCHELHWLSFNICKLMKRKITYTLPTYISPQCRECSKCISKNCKKQKIAKTAKKCKK